MSDAAKHKRRFTVDALFTDHRPQAVGVSDLPTGKEIRLDRIEGDPDQPRRSFDEEKLEELADSIAREGVLQPIVVRYDDARDVYVIVHGERRWRASQRAGLATVPAIVRDVPADRRLIHQLMENVVRDDLNALDRAAALRALRSQLGDAPWDDVADAVGIKRSRLFQLLGTEKLPESIQEDIRAGRLSEKQSRALQGLLPSHQIALRDVIVAEDLPAEEAMRIAKSLRLAKVADDPRVAAEAIARFRVPKPSVPPQDELRALVGGIVGAASGGKTEDTALKRLIDRHKVPRYKAARLETDVLGVTRALARIPKADLKPGTPQRDALEALAQALDAVLAKR